jgi:hypothetical protein
VVSGARSLACSALAQNVDRCRFDTYSLISAWRRVFCMARVGSDASLTTRVQRKAKKLVPRKFSITVKPFLIDFVALKAEWEKEGDEPPADAEEEWKWEELWHWYQLQSKTVWGRSRTKERPRSPFKARTPFKKKHVRMI